jgi:hypothetical protein
MEWFLVRLTSAGADWQPTAKGELRGVVERGGLPEPVPFRDGAELLRILRSAAASGDRDRFGRAEGRRRDRARGEESS